MDVHTGVYSVKTTPLETHRKNPLVYALLPGKWFVLRSLCGSNATGGQGSVSTVDVHLCGCEGLTVAEAGEEHPWRKPDLGWLFVVADPVRVHILRALIAVNEATAADLASWGQASNQTLRRHLEALIANGVLHERPGESDGKTPGRPAARFSLHPDVRESVESVFRFSPRSV
jgi:DNA-binding transcriptional ArsR family regulator